MLLAAGWIQEHLLHVHPFPGLGWVGSVLGLSSHVFSMFIAAALMLWIFPKAAKQEGLVPTGLRNFVEVILVFLRNEVGRPFLGHDVDKYMPTLWTFFFFVLFCNLLGLIPGMATATGQYMVTGTLAFTAFLWWHACGIHQQGLVPYIKNIVPPGLPFWLVPLMYVIEIVSHIIKPCALMIRLCANMMAGHAVLYGFLGLVFIFKSFLVGPVSVGFASGVYMLEILVAFIQAYVFTFLVTVFLGAAVHPDH